MTSLILGLPGMLFGIGIVVLVSAFRPQHARLGDALAVMAAVDSEPPADVPQGGVEGIGDWWLTRYPPRAAPERDRQLRLRGRSLAHHLGIKALAAVAGFLIPVVTALTVWIITGTTPLLPALAGVVLAAVGFILPDVQLRMATRTTAADATEALLVYFDLVTLERLANQSASQALTAPAGMSDHAVFASIRTALERARLQQRLPYDELTELGHTLKLSALVDLADVMRLDESGASLAGTLRARVKELRGAHLTTTKMQAAETSERMTIVMVVPSLVLGLFFLAPPLLTLMSNG